MPPEGYETLTVPKGLVQQLDDLPGDSHTATLRHLLAEYRTDGNTDAECVELTRSAVDDIATETASRVSQEVEQSLR
jgi:hypothetical protein